jgi:hypothetical protein
MERNAVLARIWEVYQAGGYLAACAWCSRVRIDGEWLEPPQGAISTIDARMTLSHSICPECADSRPSTASSLSTELEQEPR